jgi:hypothetical protein
MSVLWKLEKFKFKRMDTSITFKKTNSFWIDNGIVGLFKVLEQIKERDPILGTGENFIEYDLLLGKDDLKITLLNPSNLRDSEDELHPDLLTILNEAKVTVVNTYLTTTKNAGWFFRDNAFVVYRKNDFKMHLKSFFTGKTPKTEGGICVPFDKKEVTRILESHKIPFNKSKDGTISLTERYFKNYSGKKENDKKEVVIPNLKVTDVKASDRIMSEEEFISFFNFIEHESLLTIEGAKPISLAGRGFHNTQPAHEIGNEFSSTFLEKGSKFCSFSGEKVKIADVVTGMDFPFMTGKSGELNFASNLEGKALISSKYAFIGLFSLSQLHFLNQDKTKNYFILYDNDLKELSNFYNIIQIDLSQLKNSNYCNFTTSMYNLEFESETLFNFALSIYKQVKGKLGKDKRNQLFSKSVFTFTNDGNIFRDVKQYSSLNSLFDLFEAFGESSDEKMNFEHFLNFIRFFIKKMKTSKGEKYDTTWRNRLCSDLLNFRSIAKTIEWYFGEVRLKEEKPSAIFYLDKIISIYNSKTQFNMKSEMVDLCKSIGNRIGRYCREANNGSGDKGVLYSIRNSKNRIEFLKTLSESQFKTQVLIGEDFFKNLPDTPQWEEYKALVSIFAMNSFLYVPDKKPTNQNVAN